MSAPPKPPTITRPKTDGKSATSTLEGMKKDLQQQVDQLQKEASMERMKTSAAVGELLKFIHENQGKDPLLQGNPPPNSPYEQKSKCSTL